MLRRTEAARGVHPRPDLRGAWPRRALRQHQVRVEDTVRPAGHREDADIREDPRAGLEDVDDGEKTTLLYLRAVECLRTGQEARANMRFGRLICLPISEYLRKRVKLVAPTGSR